METIKEVYIPKPGSDLSLLPCPFCGSKAVVYERYEHIAGDRWRVCCYDCCATIDPGYAQQRIDVADLWNNRTERSK
jgi:Lar family restriction alleviation protein